MKIILKALGRLLVFCCVIVVLGITVFLSSWFMDNVGSGYFLLFVLAMLGFVSEIIYRELFGEECGEHGRG